MIVAGLGRVSADVHLEQISAFKRLGSRKQAAREVHGIGGSVPWILAQTAAAGFESHYIGPGALRGPIDVARELEGLGLHCHLQDLPTPRSYIEHDAEGRLERIVSIQEAPEHHLEADRCHRILQAIAFDWLVLDGRHPAAARAAGRLARQRNAGVLIDPGSTTGVSRLIRDPDLLDLATLLCVDKDVLERLTGMKDSLLSVRSLLDRGLKQVVVTDDSGGARWMSRTVDLTLRPRDSKIPGSSLGLGDSFRGWLLAGLVLEGRHHEVLAQEAETCLRFAINAAYIRKHQGSRIPVPVSRQAIDTSPLAIDLVDNPAENLDGQRIDERSREGQPKTTPGPCTLPKDGSP